jgi:hypothetical protein
MVTPEPFFRELEESVVIVTAGVREPPIKKIHIIRVKFNTCTRPNEGKSSPLKGFTFDVKLTVVVGRLCTVTVELPKAGKSCGVRV